MMKQLNRFFLTYIVRSNLVIQIIIGLVLGVLLAIWFPNVAVKVSFLGKIFVLALQAVAPILIFVMVIASISKHKEGQPTHIRSILALYLLGTFAAALVAVTASSIFPSTLILKIVDQEMSPPQDIFAVLQGLLLKIVDNPVKALVSGNFIGLLAWGIGLGFALRKAGDATKTVITDLAQAISSLVKIVIRLAPLGVFGLVAATFAESGVSVLKGYIHVLLVLLGSMAAVVLIVNPLIVYWKIRRNPFPLVFLCLKESGITAFFTRSSAANVPVNLQLCERLGLHEDTYSISIPLGAAINMAGAAVTITVLTMAAVNTLGITVDFWTAILLSVLASIGACGASGVAGGSLLLIPLACNLFGVPNEIAMQVIAVGIVISVLQDSAETAVNSSTDVLFTAAACLAKDKNNKL